MSLRLGALFFRGSDTLCATVFTSSSGTRGFGFGFILAPSFSFKVSSYFLIWSCFSFFGSTSRIKTDLCVIQNVGNDYHRDA